MESEQNQIRTLKAHLALNVQNVEQSIAFYRKLLGIDPSKVRTGYAKFDVQHPPLNLTLNQHSVQERGALSHLGIQVESTNDVLAMKRRWEEVGLLTRDEMQTRCCYALQDKAWVRDPDGNEWEVFVVLEDNLAETIPCECGTKVETGSREEEVKPTATMCCAPSPVEITNAPNNASSSCC